MLEAHRTLRCLLRSQRILLKLIILLPNQIQTLLVFHYGVNTARTTSVAPFDATNFKTFSAKFRLFGRGNLINMEFIIISGRFEGT